MLDRGSVFVWEWQDETSLWRPYSPQVAYYIEQVVRETPKSNSVSLGEADASLTPYILDLISMNQFRLDTGTLYPVRRVNFPLSSAPGRGIVWEWEELPHQWVPFETRLSILIQDALERQQTSVRLGQPCNGSHICFQTMTQIEFPSQKRIRVRARAQIPYPKAGSKCSSTQYHIALPQYLNAYSNSKHGSFTVQQQHTGSSHGPVNFQQERVNDSKPELLRSQSRSTPTDSKPSLASPHHRISHANPNLAGRSLSRSVSLKGSRSPPPCACPHCLLLQSVKSASWPGRQLDSKPVKAQPYDSQRCEKSKGLTRVPPVPLGNIEGSGMIPPALAGISGLLMSAAGLPVCLSIPATPIFNPPPVKKKDIRPVPGIQGSSRKISNKKSKKPEEMIKQFLQRVKTPLSEDCALCDQPMTDGEVGRLYRCSHAYHVRCLSPLYKDGTLRCPTCQTLYGVKIGSQPPGKMSFHIIPHSLPGYSEFETIRIIFHIPPAVQGPGQPHPGMKFTAPDFPLHCYLPNTKKGREILLLLIKAWEKRLLFPVLPSRTPGVLDSVSISRIPLKTEFGSNITGKGFPDSRYLDSVLRQLRDWGVSND
ncbi:PREDICTED: E3 ubiquitin-protein ligase DTX4-like [Nanorana parkeri]|uniref:E3 ubiquitin-protein ligase DTX4-like n=1 Tax=Nanorana parkeri TaxID=125878 RepID=UPI000854FE7B|nr:PREDICTED: E3 ubiquitin-protein ligase DTX4-like [Nanorana parkeri]